jgi:cation transport ATPase
MIKAENKEKIKSTLSLVLNLAISILTMSFIFVLAGRVSQGDQAGASLFLGLSIISVLGYQVFLFIMYPNFKDRVRLIAISAVYSIALIFAFMARNDINLFFLSTFFVLLAIATSQILRVFIRNKDKTALEIITNILIGVVLILLAI